MKNKIGKALAVLMICEAIGLMLYSLFQSFGHDILTNFIQGQHTGWIGGIVGPLQNKSMSIIIDISDDLFLIVAMLLMPVGILHFVFFRNNIFTEIVNGKWLEEHTTYIDKLPEKHIGYWIALASALGLFLELMIIRLHASYFQLFAYFKNVSLLSCFLGLGLGFALKNRNPLKTPLVLPLLAFQTVILFALRFSNLRYWLQNPIVEEYMFGMGQITGFLGILFVYSFLIVIFSFNALCFIPIGHTIARLMDRESNLVSYSWNLIGSIGGTLFFALLSFLWTPPIVWVIFGAFGLLVFYWRDRMSSLVSVVSILVVTTVLSLPVKLDQYDVYSPYQILSLQIDRDHMVTLKTSNSYFQRMVNPKYADVNEVVKNNHYDLPYYFQAKLDEVLIVGSGTGNDVASALRHGAQRIDAVEIDPAILSFGRQLHPEDPYASEKVSYHVNDARAFIRNTDNTYDMIIYGLLDSHTLLANKGAVRLDSFVYTVEAFKEARSKLKENGVISLTFSLLHKHLGKKIYLMIKEAFGGKEPLIFQTSYDAGVSYLIGDNFHYKSAPQVGELPSHISKVNSKYVANSIQVDKSTDNWPFFYMPVKKYPYSYLIMIFVLLGISTVFISKALSKKERGFSFPCFFLGAGFMLLETKAITELALVYGSTWIVISAVIIAILIMAFFANLLVLKRGTLPLLLTYGMLIAMLLVGYGMTYVSLGSLHMVVSRVFLTMLLTVPLFFSGIAFSTELKHSLPINIILASNLLGAMFGGFLEYNSMWLGFRSLYLLAVFMYFMAFLTSGKSFGAKRAAIKK